MTDATIVHRMPGRLRIRVPAMRGVDSYFTGISERLGAADGVRAVTTNAATASILLQFEGDAETVLERLHELDLHAQIKGDRSEATWRSPLPPVRLVSGRQINPLFMAGCALATAGVVQAVRGKIMVPSVTALWYAVEAFRAALRDE